MEDSSRRLLGQYSVVFDCHWTLELAFLMFKHISGDGRVGEEKVLTLRQQLSFRGQSLCLPVIKGAVKELFSKVVSPLHPVCTWKWLCFQLQGWLESLCCHWTCEHFRLFCERSRKSCFPWFRALQLLQNWNKLWSDQIWFWILLHTHRIVYILVIVHRILKVYQNWTEFIITHEWSCEKKLYLEIIKTNVVYSAAQKSKIGISAHISELYTRQCLVLMVKIRRETILDNDIRTRVMYMSENWKYSSVPT